MQLITPTQPKLELPGLIRVGEDRGGIVRAGLVAWYKFNEGQGQRLVDWSGYGNHGTLGSSDGADTNDPAWTNRGLVFGADDYAVTPLLFSPLIASGITTYSIVAVVNNTAGAISKIVYGERSSSTTNPVALQFYFVNNAPAFYVRDDALNSAATVSPTAYSGAYAMYTGVRNGNKVYLYRNTTLLGTGTATLGVITVDRATIGANRSTTTDYYFDSTEPIAFLAAYKVALALPEITQIFNALKAELASRGVVFAS